MDCGLHCGDHRFGEGVSDLVQIGYTTLCATSPLRPLPLLLSLPPTLPGANLESPAAPPACLFARPEDVLRTQSQQP